RPTEAEPQRAVVDALVGREDPGLLGVLAALAEDLAAGRRGPQERLEHHETQVCDRDEDGERDGERVHGVVSRLVVGGAKIPAARRNAKMAHGRLFSADGWMGGCGSEGNGYLPKGRPPTNLLRGGG